MITLVAIVEGHGEVAALPVLLWRIRIWLAPDVMMQVVRPMRVARNRFLHDDVVFRRTLQAASDLCRQPGWILILLDADNDCPMLAAARILKRARQVIPHRRISVVLANREYEAWFIAAARSLDGKLGFSVAAVKLPAAESVRGAKEWMNERLPRSKIYRPTQDQLVFSGLIDLRQAHDNSRSFGKLCSDWTRQMADTGP